MSKYLPFLTELERRLEPLRNRLAAHPLYSSIRSLDALHLFMESHVFAVWDFMSLLKTLQRGLTSVTVPWLPSANAEARRLINEIVLGEESDLYDGRAVSHFELYLEAMQASGADARSIRRLLEALRGGADVEDALTMAAAPDAARSFVNHTFFCIDQKQLHKVAAAFTFGREDLIPDMFRGFVRDLDRAMAGKLDMFVWYLERHIEVDGEEHGPMALRMVASLCGEDPKRWQEATETAEAALQARLDLWDGILASIVESSSDELEKALGFSSLTPK
jgi:hypothetical protein